MIDLWRRGKHVRSIHDLYYQPEPVVPDGPLPAWAESLLVIVLVIFSLGLIVYGWTHAMTVHS